MAIFNSYISLPEGNNSGMVNDQLTIWLMMVKYG